MDFASRVEEWSIEPSVGLAGDIVSAALVSGQTAIPEIASAAEFILAHQEISSTSLVSAAHKVLGTDDAQRQHSILLPRLTTFLEEHSRQETYRKINKLKVAAAQFGRDPILYTELARLYLIVGNLDKAKTNIAIALALAPVNRFVLRSAARLYAHCKEADRAFDLLHRNPRTRHDPWLASAELAMAGLVDRSSKVIKGASRVLASDKFSQFSLTELNAGVGSVELLNGDRRRSRKLLQASLLAPNDNSLAQVEWALSHDGLFEFDLSSFNVSRNYEALALEAFNEQQWTSVLRHCESWLMDMPFATRPVMMATHVATVVLDDFKAAQLFCQAGRLVAFTPSLVNSYAYALALDNKPTEAIRVLDEMPLSTVDDARAKVYLTATRGLALFRDGQVQEGRAMYATAIEAAKDVPDPAFRNLALLNYVREELRANQKLPESLVEAIRKMKTIPASKTMTIFRDKVVALLDAATVDAT